MAAEKKKSSRKKTCCNPLELWFPGHPKLLELRRHPYGDLAVLTLGDLYRMAVCRGPILMLEGKPVTARALALHTGRLPEREENAFRALEETGLIYLDEQGHWFLHWLGPETRKKKPRPTYIQDLFPEHPKVLALQEMPWASLLLETLGDLYYLAKTRGPVLTWRGEPFTPLRLAELRLRSPEWMSYVFTLLEEQGLIFQDGQGRWCMCDMGPEKAKRKGKT